MGNGESREPSIVLSENLLREVKIPFCDVYDIEEQIGHGSISNIFRIRKKLSALGGSSNRDFVKKHKQRISFPRISLKVDDERNERPESEFEPVTATEKTTSSSLYYALKEINLTLVNDRYLSELQNEIDLLKTLDHPNIIKAYETYRIRKRSICIVMELCTGGDLYTRQPYTEREAANITGKVLSAIAYLHSKSIIHRDIKFENILFENDTQSAEVKLIDFGLAKCYVHVLMERVGTVYTMAPQVLQGVYTSQADLWSLGVVTYMLLSGQKPFWGSTKNHVISNILRGKVQFKGNRWKLISKEGKDFVLSLLEVNPKKRLNAMEALEHKWLSKEYNSFDREPSEDIMNSVEDSFIRYANASEFHKLALNVLARVSTPPETIELRKAFDQYDVNNDGTVSYEEFKTILLKYCSHGRTFSDKQIEDLFKILDFNKNNHIMYTEFLAATLAASGTVEEHHLAEAFHQIDADNTGYISKENLFSILGKRYNKIGRYIDEMVAEVDKDGDGQISYKEFLNVFTSGTNANIKTIYNDANQSDGRGLFSVVGDAVEKDGNVLLSVDTTPIYGGKNDPALTEISLSNKNYNH